jgi:RNA polymerase sigma factor (sigma-70 family)
MEVEELWYQYYPKVFGYFFRRVNNREDVEDLTSITLTNFLQKWLEKGQEIQHREGYLWRIAHNQLANFIRHKSKKPVPLAIDEDWQLIDEKLEVEYSHYFRERVQALIKCVQDFLDPTQYRLVKESIFHDRKSPELAEELDMTPANVRQKLSRALQKVRRKCRNLWIRMSELGDDTPQQT